VVKVGSAVAVNNTSFVELPGFSIDDDAQWADVNERNLHGSFVLGGGGVTPRSDGGLNEVSVVRASSGLSSGSGGVWVGLLSFETFAFNVTEGRGEISSVATIASVIARHELLRGKDVEGSGLDAIGRFNSFSGREGPARTTLTLVLDGGDALRGGSPVV